MDKKVYWIWLQNALGYSANIYELMLYFGSAQGLYEAGENEWRGSGLFGNDLLGKKDERLEKLCSVDISSAVKTFEYCMKSDYKIITPEDELYPKSLKNLLNMPAVLYIKGDIKCLENKLAIGVIGTRRPSDYGVKAAKEITADLVKNNALIVSGGAFGIDSVAHTAAIESGGKTVLVMGCGFDAKYLPENQPLRDAVEQNGALVTEYQPNVKAMYHTFPQRNRIISGMSRGIVIVEAGEGSGTLNTAGHAKRQGRDIFVVSGGMHSANFAGSNKLISEGARVIYSANDILSFYKYEKIAINEIKKLESKAVFDGIDNFQDENYKPKKAKKTSEKSKQKITEEKEIIKKEEKISKNPPEGVSKNAMMVYNIISSGKNQLDDIVRQSAIPVNKVLAALTELEIVGSVELSEGNKYIIS